VRVYKIKRESLLKLLNQYPNDKEKYCSLRDRLIMKESVPLAIQCYSCHSTSHLIHECHILHFCPDKEAIIKRELFPIE
jgi:potassium voltage-gated channel Eag-related subfamily H protein 7